MNKIPENFIFLNSYEIKENKTTIINYVFSCKMIENTISFDDYFDKYILTTDNLTNSYCKPNNNRKPITLQNWTQLMTSLIDIYKKIKIMNENFKIFHGDIYRYRYSKFIRIY